MVRNKDARDHGGQTLGYTVPNKDARGQYQVIGLGPQLCYLPARGPVLHPHRGLLS